MNMIQATSRTQKRRSPRRLVWISGLIAILACESLLEVDLPGDVSEDRVGDVTLATLITESVRGALECAVSNTHMVTAMFGNETLHGSGYGGMSFAARHDSSLGQGYSCIERDDRGPSSSGAQYIAAAHGRDMTRNIEDLSDAEYPSRQFHLAYRTIFTAHAMSILGENYCEAVLEPDGMPLSPTEVLTEAEAWFTKGLDAANSAGETTAINLGLMGRARVRLNLGNLGGAVADAQLIPEDWEYVATRSATPGTRENQVWKVTWKTLQNTIHPNFRNLLVQGVADVRVQTQDSGNATFDGNYAGWWPDKYSSAGSSHRIASWAEAQLIIAEAQLGQTAVDRINALRVKHSLPLYVPVDVSDATEILDQVIIERSREHFFEGRLLNDMIRFRGRATPAVIQWLEGFEPRGIYDYQELYCIPIPNRERDSNPNVGGQLDANGRTIPGTT